jgi:hypothetical protein
MRCVESGEIRKSADVMPRPDVSYTELHFRLASEYTPADFELLEGEELILACTINCRGESFDFNAKGLKNRKDLNNLLGLYRDVKWLPAEDKGEPVDCLVSCSFKVVDDQFVLSIDKSGKGVRSRRRE